MSSVPFLILCQINQNKVLHYCELCKYGSYHITVFNHHMKILHPQVERMYKCYVCKVTTTYFTNYIAHIANHISVPHSDIHQSDSLFHSLH